MQQRILWSAMLAAGLLSACGGGGGDAPAASPAPTAKVTLSGVAAKGLMANAVVTAHPVVNGVVDESTVLATAETDASGNYSLDFEGTAGQPYVIRVKAKSDGSTTHLDEATGTSQALPADFTMRALIVPATGGTITTSASVTPFTEMAVSAAARATGGLTADNARQAQSTVQQLLGFDPAATTVKATNAANATPEEQKLALMLTAVSKMAQSGALGCASEEGGAKTRCVVDKLASAAKTDSIKLGDANDDVSGALNTAVTDVLADPELKGSVDDSVVSSIRDNLACTTDCAAAPISTAGAVATMRTLFANLKADMQALFSDDGVSVSSVGAVNQEAYKFQQAVETLQVPLDQGGRLVGAMIKGIHQAERLKAGTGPAAKGYLPGDFHYTGYNGRFIGAIGCTVFSDAASTTTATSGGTVGSIGCRVTMSSRATFDGTNFTTTNYMHGVTLTPSPSDPNVYTYTTAVSKRVCQAPTVQQSCAGAARIENLILSAKTLTPSATGFTGTVTLTRNAAGEISGFTVQGEAGALLDETTNYASVYNEGGYTTLRVNGTQSAGTLAPVGAVLDNQMGGTLRSFKAGDVLDSELAFQPKAIQRDDTGEAVAGSLAVRLTTADAEVAGTLSLDTPKANAAGTIEPSKAAFTGRFANKAADGSFVDFIRGTFNATTDRTAYDPDLPESATNTYTISADFALTVTAPSRPVVRLSGGFTENVVVGDQTATLQYKTTNAAGADRFVANVTSSRVGTGPSTVTLTESTANLRMSWRSDVFDGTLKQGDTVVGEFDRNTRMLTFIDRTFISLDL